MVEENELTSITEQFLEIIKMDDVLAVREFLDEQNISEVALLIDDLPDYEDKIISNMSIHRAASVFKILDFTTQKNIIQQLSPFKTAELLNELPADDRTAFLEELPSSVVK